MNKVFLTLFLVALGLYYIIALLQYAGLFRFTQSKITFAKTLIPFYYLIK
jgi:hypothetical protein